MPPTCQVTTGRGALDTISGTKEASGVDMFRIRIDDPATFSASTVGLTTIDTQLFLFNTAGLGAFANDDVSGSDTRATVDSPAHTAYAPPGDVSPPPQMIPEGFWRAAAMWFERLPVARVSSRDTSVPPLLHVKVALDMGRCGPSACIEIMSNPQLESAICLAPHQAAWANRPTYW